MLVLRTRPLAGRPYVPRELASRVSVADAPRRRGPRAADGLGRDLRPGRVRPRAPPRGGRRRRRRDRRPGRGRGAAGARRRRDGAARRGRLLPRPPRGGCPRRGDGASFREVAARLDGLYGSLGTRRRAARRDGDPLGDRPWILADLTCTPGGRTTARSRSSSSSTMPRRRVSARSRHRPQRLRRRARGARARARDLIVIPGEEVKTDGQGEVIGLFLEQEISRGMSFADTIAAIRTRRASTSRTRSTASTRSRTPPPCAATWPTSTCSRQRTASLRRLQRRGRPLRREVQPDSRRGLRRARPPGRGDRRRPHAPLRGQGGVPAGAPHRPGTAPPEVPRVPAGTQVDRPGQGKGPLEANLGRPP